MWPQSARSSTQVPVILSHRPDSWKVLLGAYLLPPLVGTVLSYGLIGPLLRRHRLQQAGAKCCEHLTPCPVAKYAPECIRAVLHNWAGTRGLIICADVSASTGTITAVSATLAAPHGRRRYSNDGTASLR